MKISKPAVYKSCKRLFKADLLDGRIVRKGELPEKVIYTVNPKGKRHFNDLMKHYSSNIQHIYFNFNSFLWHIEKLDRPEALDMLEGLQRSLITIKTWLKAHAEDKHCDATIPFSGKMIIKQYQMIMAALVEWIAETISEYKKLK